jgi:DNA-binding NtrC family response regulator
LRARGADAVAIAEAMLKRFSDEEGKAFERLSPEVAALFARLPWPGNVRQLLNVLRNVVVLHSGREVTLPMLPLELHHHAELDVDGGTPAEPVPARNGASAVAAAQGAALEALTGRPLAEIERLVIEATLARHGGSVLQAARELDVAPSTLYRKLDAWRRAAGAA